jgi:hypothetical protein
MNSQNALQDAADVANMLLDLEQAKHPVAVGVVKSFVRLFAEKIKAGEPVTDAALKSAELAVSEAILAAGV